MTTKRPAALSGAVVLLVFSGLANLLVAAIALWQLTTWSRWLAIVASAFSVILGLGGAIYATSPLVKGLGLALVISGALVIALMMVPSARQAYAAAR